MSPVGRTTSPNVLTSAIWQHVAVTYDGQLVKFYYNGTKVTQVEAVQMTALSSSYIGSYGGGASERFFLGSIDEVRLYDRALSDSDMLALYT